MKIRKFLARLLCLCMALNMIPAFSEGETADSPAVDMTAVIENTVEAADDVSDAAQTEQESVSEPADDAVETDIADAEPGDETETAENSAASETEETVQNSDVDRYMRIEEGPVCLYAGSAEGSEYCGKTGEGVVYALSEAEGRTLIKLNISGAVNTYWVNSAALSAMTDEEVQSYLSVCGDTAVTDSETGAALMPADYHAAALTVTLDSTVVGIGDSTTLHVDVSGAEDPSELAFSYDKTYLAGVSAEGETYAIRLKGIKETAAAQITVTCGTLRAEATLKVTAAPAKCTLTAEKTELFIGESTRTTAVLTEGTVSKITYTSDNDAVATVDADGVITAVGAGEAEICAATYKSGVSGSVKVHAYAVPTTVETDKAQYDLVKGSKVTVAVTALNGDGSACEAMASASGFESSDTAVFTVDAGGVITAVGAGTAELTATVNGVEAKAAVCVADLIVNRNTITIGVGNIVDLFESGCLSYSGTDAIEGVTFKSSAVKIATVTNQGVVKGIKAGSAVITVNLGNGTQKRLAVKVLSYPKTMKLNAASFEMGIKATRQLKVTFNKNAATLYTFASSDERIATVDDTGRITGVSAGTADIIVAAVSGKFASAPLTCKVTVLPAPQSIAFETENYTICEGASLSVPVTYAEGTGADITYTSEDETLVTVDSDGRITALTGAAGKTVRIRAVTQTGASCETEVKVEPVPTKVAFSEPGTIAIGVGNTVQLPDLIITSGDTVITSAAVSYTSGKTSIVKVDANGLIKGVAAGTATITAKTYNGVKATIKVTVYKYPTTMKLSKTELELGVYCTYKLNVSFNKNAYTKYTFRSSKPSVVSVTEDGTLTCHAEGEVTITCSADSGKFSSNPVECTVTVLPAPESVQLDAEEYNIAAGDKRTVSVSCDAGSYADIVYESSDTDVFTVSESGVITAKDLEQGEIRSATLTATAQNGLAATAAVTVSNAPTSVAFSGVSSITVTTGDTFYLPSLVFGGKETGEPVRVAYKSSKASVITVNDSANGLVTAKSAGTAYITVTTYNGKTDKLKITVVKGTVSAIIPNYTSHTYYIRAGQALPELIRLEAYPVISGKVLYGGAIFTSSDTSVATVSANGTVTPVSAGTAVITITSVSGKTAECTVTVWKASRTVTFGNNPVLGVMQTDTLVPVFDDSKSSSDLTYTSSDSSVLTVDEDGNLTAKSAGTAVISVEGSYGLETAIDYTVLPGPDAVQLTGSEVTLQPGDRLDLKPTCVASAEPYYSGLTVTSSDTNIVTVSGNTVKAVSAGTATVTVTACNGVSAQCEVTVAAAGTKTDVFTAAKACVFGGKSGTLEALITKGSTIYRYGYELTTDDASVISVDGKNVTAEAETGSATISLVSNGTVLDTIVLKIADTAEAELTVNGNPVTTADTIELYTEGSEDSTANITVSAKCQGMPIVGDIDLAVTVDPAEMATVFAPPQSGTFSGVLTAGKTAGSACLIVTVGGTAISYQITITAPAYRALIIGEFVDSWYGSLPFARENMNGIESALSSRYESVNVDVNPNKAAIVGDLAALAGVANNHDVTFIYIVAHGYYDSDEAPGTYAFGISTGTSKKYQTYMTSSELLSVLKAIPGKVILALDSCKSGYFVDYASSRISSDGNIAIITNQKHAEGAWYMDGNVTCEFFTAALMYALGNRTYAPYFSSLTGSADANNDGELTLGEVCDYTLDRTPKIVLEKIQTFKKGYFYIGSATGAAILAKYSNYTLYNREGDSYIPSGMRDLVIG